ncbi:MAG: 50S ribosomal protein L3 [Nitrospinae bacterium]|nr:50S ribosomal protein L3 [Nitrospinota bacterium]MBI3813291.1 50S ribosomal protein L3 [Nitrospinota bacterium]
MLNGLLGKKIGMTQIFAEDGTVIPVTIIEAGPCTVVQKKTVGFDGYNAVQVGFTAREKKGINKPLKGHFEKAKAKPFRFLRELRMDNSNGIEVGQTIGVDIFQAGESIDISGISKGRGFAGVMKRHGFAGFPASRGTHEYFRHSGSISGGRTIRSRILLGKKMPGHMGCEKVTLLNLKVVKVIKENNLLLVKGGIPGANGGILMIRKRKK